MSKKSVAILAGAAFLASVSLYAQEAETKTESEVDDDVITVTASKIDEDISKTTEKVQVITGEMIEQSGSHTLNEVLNSVPGMSFIGKTVGNSEPLQMNGFTDEYVKILIDGVPVSTGGSSAIYSYISTDNIDHIEVIEGSSSAIWGSDAIAGVINIITKKRDEEKILSGSITGEARTDKSYFGSGDVAVNYAGFSAEGKASYDYKHGDYESATYTNPVSGKQYSYDNYDVPEEKTWMAGGKIGWHYDDILKFSLSTDYTEGSSKDITSTQHDDGYYQPFTKTLNALFTGDWNINDDHSLSSYVSARRYESGTHNQNFSGTWDAETSKQFVDFEGEILYTGYITEMQQLMAGVNSQYSTYNDDNADSEAEASFEAMNASLFAQDSIQFGSLTAVPGFRAFFSIPVDENHDEDFIFNFSPKLSFRYELNDEWAFKLSGGSGFKLPTLTQKYNDHYKGKGNPDLNPEVSYSVNLGADWKPFKGFSVTADGYFTYLHDMIDAIDWYEEDGSWGGRNYENFGNVISTGANLKAEYKKGAWNAYLAYNYLFMRQIVDGDFEEITGKIPHQIKGSVTYSIEKTRTDVNLNAFWYAPRSRSTTYDYGSGTSATRTSDYFKVNARIDQHLWGEHLTLYAGVKNLLNSISFVKSNAGQTMKESFGSGDGITFYLGAKYAW
ncbi:MAG: TonB-dependent receptor [Treponema sp.]|nr:TonB-dependent receptor [Treponema sp.]